MKKRRVVIQFLFLIIALLSVLLGSMQYSAVTQSLNQADGTSPNVTFVDVTAESGIMFRHDNAASKEKYLVETMGSGCAFLDYDQDGFLDVFFVNGGPTPAYQPTTPLKNALYHSEGNGHFVDVTSKSGVESNAGFGMGVAVGDFDNDGYPDLYVTGFPSSSLYHNDQHGSFTDITQKAGVENSKGWGVSAAWLDYDNDGYLDLLVINYLDFDYARNKYCGEPGTNRSMYCHPRYFDGVYPVLYRNEHNGKFSDVTKQAGLQAASCKGLGVVAADFDNDGWIDIFISNDSVRNLLYRNLHNGSFEDVTLPSGTGYSDDGMPEAGMGVDAADFNRDGWMDIYVTHLDFELNRLYLNHGGMRFSDSTISSGLARTAVLNSGFGTRFLDYDNDGWKDLVLVNGHVMDNVNFFRRDVFYAEKKMLYRNSRGRFTNVSAAAGPAFAYARVGRGLALGDFDNDGDLDFLVNNNGQNGELIRNDGGNNNHWLAIRLIGVNSNRDGVGARIELTAGGTTQFDQAKGGMSYLSASDPRIYFGLGQLQQADRVEIHWPSGKTDVFKDVQANQLLSIQEGKGIILSNYPEFKRRQ